MHDHTFNLLKDLRPVDAHRVDEIFPAQRRLELLAAITGVAPLAEPGQRADGTARRLSGSVAHGWPGARARRLLRPLVLGTVGVVAAAIAAVAVLTTGSAVSPTYANAVSFHTVPSGEIVATVTEPFAAQSRLDAEFTKQGLHITVQLIPVSPASVGKLLYVTGSSSETTEIEPLEGGHCLMGGGGCAIGVKIPRDFVGSGSIALGRPAKPGEAYESSASAFAPGEPLHCSGLLGAKVASALPTLEHDKLTVQWGEVTSGPTGAANGQSPQSSQSKTDLQPPLQNYIWSADMTAAGELSVTTQSTPWPDNPGAGSDYNNGC